MTKVVDFDYWTDYLADTIEAKNLKFNEDQVILVCGYEGTGKSTFTIASYCEVSRKRNLPPSKDLIFYEWDEYLKTNLAAMIGRLDSMPPGLVQELLLHYKIGPTDLKMPKGTYIPNKGDILCYDEAGTQAFNRQAMKGQNVHQVKLLIANRFLNLCHMWNVPKPGSCDRYIREERAKILVWVDSYYTKDWSQKIRNVYIYGKSSYQRILGCDKWWTLFNNTQKLIRTVKPDMEVKIPLNLPDYIPKDINEYYETKKNVFNIRQVLDMLDTTKEKEVAPKVDHMERMVQDGESLTDWVKRTGCTPTQYTPYGGSIRKYGR